ncbi:hypothetical protein BJV82DRAFT_378537 [Fennellomyces sp. T-0311]|nr:hypothetical protein BJV82DRAFT_378537 [Fennellomyces sp. T-0311]
MTGRPQFAQRVKRWMRKYRIDCYFDYLLGNPYSFHSPDEKYSGCLMMGNYQKRKSGKAQAVATDETDSVKSSGSGSRTRKRSRYYMLTDEEDDEEDDDHHGSSDDEHRTPIVLAGSRKRSRISPHQHVSTESMRLSKALQESHRSSEENDDDDDDNNNNDNNEEEGDEEDELASTSSSSTVSRNINRSTPNHDLIPSHHQPQQHHATAGPSSSPLPCADCIQVQQTVSSLQQDISQLKEHIAALQGKLDQEVQSKQDMAKQLSRLESICLHYDHWRTKLAENLLQNPLTTEALDRKPNSTVPNHKS